MDKRKALIKLARKRQRARWPGYKNLRDYHCGAYECLHVSPYTKSAGNVDSPIMVFLQDWTSDESIRPVATRTASDSATLLRCPPTGTSSACYRRILAFSSERYMPPTCSRSLSLGTWVTPFLDAISSELLRSMRCLRFRLFSRNSSFVLGSRLSTRYARSVDILVFIHSPSRFAALSRSTARASGARHIREDRDRRCVTLIELRCRATGGA